MRILIYFLVLGLSIGFLSSCKEKEKPKEKTALDLLYDEVMIVHDEVMPLMSDMERNQSALKKYNNTNSELPEEFKNRIRTSITNLENTSEAMMEWMSQFSDPSRKDEEMAKKYFNDQKMKISKVSIGMKLAYEKSAVLLNDLKEQQDQ
jgi:hypothetical protein